MCICIMKPIYVQAGILCTLSIQVPFLTLAYVVVPRESSWRTKTFNGALSLWATPVVSMAEDPVQVIDDATRLQIQIEDYINSKGSFDLNTKGDKTLEEWIRQLENCPSTIDQPNRSPAFRGLWHVWYTNCPPPSNGRLGPFQGTASQVVDAQEGSRSYQNLLQVPPNAWLSATLDGIWEEWDGRYLEPPNSLDTESSLRHLEGKDFGKDHWKVTFVRLNIALFGGSIVLFQKEFPPQTSRIWRTTYLDSNVRIVRAGKTGHPQDEYVFYTKRVPCTK